MRAWSRPLQALLWRDAPTRARRLLRFAAVEADGGRDIVRAAELTHDPVLRRLYLAHARDERHHAELFQARGLALLRECGARGGRDVAWLAPGERGLDDLRVDEQDEAALLAFLHLSEKAAAEDFATYRDALAADPQTRAVFEAVLKDEVFHMNYTATQLARLARDRKGWLLWRTRTARLWKAFVRVMAALAGVLGTLMLTVQYFVVLPPFAWLARRAARREPDGFAPIAPERNGRLDRQY
jgi:hypothetical protein